MNDILLAQADLCRASLAALMGRLQAATLTSTETAAIARELRAASAAVSRARALPGIEAVLGKALRAPQRGRAGCPVPTPAPQTGVRSPVRRGRPRPIKYG